MTSIPDVADGDVFTVSLYRQIQAAINEGVMRPLGAASVAAAATATELTFSSIPGDYKVLVLIANLRSNNASTPAALVRCNGDASSVYDGRSLVTRGTSSITGAEDIGTTGIKNIQVAGTGSPSNTFSNDVWIFPQYASTVMEKAALVMVGNKIATSGNGVYTGYSTGFWRSTAAITQLSIHPGAGSFDQYSAATLLGVA